MPLLGSFTSHLNIYAHAAKAPLWWKVCVFLFSFGGVSMMVLSLLFVTRPLQASGPSSNQVLNYQARLTDNNGIPLPDGTKNVKFVVYDALTVGNCEYSVRGTCGTPTAKSVTVANGHFSTQFGEAGDVAMPAGLFSGDESRFLEIQVETSTPGTYETLSPRKRIVSGPFAMNANLLDDLDTDNDGGSNAFVPVTDASGNLVLTRDLSVSTFTIPGSTAPSVSSAGQGRIYFDSTSNKFRVSENNGAFADLVGASGLSGWTDDGTTVRLTTSTDNVGIGTTSPGAALDVSSGNMTLLLGADSNALTRTDATQKAARLAMPHYTNAEEPAGIVFGSSGSGDNQVAIGGGSALFNAATIIQFFTAANTTTTTGTERMRINSTGIVGIGTSTANVRLGQKLDIAASADYSGMSLSTWSADTSDESSILDFKRSRSNTIGTHTIVQSGDALGYITFQGSSGSSFSNGAAIGGFVDGTPGAADMPGRLLFYTTPDGSSTVTERMRISNNGAVGIGTTSSIYPLWVRNDTLSDGAWILSDTTNARFKGLRMQTAGSARWDVLTNTTTETGSNAGSNFEINAFSDAGTYLATRLHISRSTGNVGIGTTTPAQKLIVFGNNTDVTQAILSGAAGNYASLSIGRTAGEGHFAMSSGAAVWSDFATAGDLVMRSDTGDIIITARNASGAVYLATGADDTAKLTVLSGGNVGIGTTVPSQKLHIGSATDSAIFLEADTDNATETDNAFIKFSQDGAAVQSILGTVGNADFDPENVAYTGALANATLLGTTDALGVVQFGTNDNVRMTIDTTGNVGIGTTTPSMSLHVLKSQNASTQILVQNVTAGAAAYAHFTSGSDSATSFFGSTSSTTSVIPDAGFVIADSNSSGGLVISARAAAPITFFTNGLEANERMRIDSAGNVGIGTTSPSFLLHAQGASTLQLGAVDTSALSTTSGGGATFAVSTTPTATDQRVGFATFGTMISGVRRNGAIIQAFSEGAWTAGVSHPTFLTFVTTASGANNGTERMRISAAGNVGIGTTSPAAALDIVGTPIQLRLSDNTTNATTKIFRISSRHYTNAQSDFTFLSGFSDISSNGLNVGGGTGAGNAATQIRFYTAANNTTLTGTERMQIDAAGNVGIGTSTVSSLLHVNGAAQLGTASATTGSLKFYNSASANATTLQAGNAATAVTYTLPTADGSSGYMLTTNGSGALSWTIGNSVVSNPGLIATATGAGATSTTTGGAGAFSSLSGATVTFTAPVAGTYLIQASVGAIFTSIASNDVRFRVLIDGATSVGDNAGWEHNVNNTSRNNTPMFVGTATLTAGAHTLQLQFKGLQTNGGTPTWTFDAESQYALAVILPGTGTDSSAYGGFGRFENYNTYSEQFDNAAWTKESTIAITANDATNLAPDGSATADKVTTGGAAAANGITQAASGAPATASTTWTGSVWMKLSTGGPTSVNLRVSSGNQTGTASAASVTSSAWQRFYVTQAFTGASTGTATFRIETGTATNVLLWGGELEQQSGTGVYAKTETTAITSTMRGAAIGNELRMGQLSADPVAANGNMYYNTSTNRFRCYENSGWKDCDANAGFGSALGVTQNVIVTGGVGPRAFATVYQNTTGKPLFVSASAARSATGTITAYSDNTVSPTTIVAAQSDTSGFFSNIFFVVAPTHYYKVTNDASASVWYWTESTIDGSGGSQWTTTGSDIYYNTGSVGIGTTSPEPTSPITINNTAAGTTPITMYLRNGGTTTGTGHLIQFSSGVWDRTKLISAAPAGDANGSSTFQLQTRQTGGGYNTGLFMDASGNVGIGTAAPISTLNIHAAAGTNPSLYFSDADVSHGLTSIVPTNVNFAHASWGSATGGAQLIGLGTGASGSVNMALVGYSGSTDPVDTDPMVVISGAKRSGTTVTALGSLETLLQIKNGDPAGGTAHLTMLGSGNVGIGTTTPGYTLNVRKAISADWLTGLENSDTGGGSIYMAHGTGEGMAVNAGSDLTGTSYAFQVNKAGTTYLYAMNGGNVGIGTDNPAQKLELYKSSGGNFLQVSSGTAGGYVGTDGTNFILQPRNSSDLTVYNTAGSTRLVTIQNDGDVGIGTTTPLARTHIINAGETLLNLTNSSASSNADWGVTIGSGGQHAQGYFVIGPGTGSPAVANKVLTLVAGGEVIIGNATASTLTIAAASLDIQASSAGAVDLLRFTGNTQGNLVPTSGNANTFKFGHNFSPTSGTATYAGAIITQTINQTGGANGVTRGLFVNPSLTAVADYRAVEMSNNSSSSYGIYQSGANTKNYFAGNIGIGTTTIPAKLTVSPTIATVSGTDTTVAVSPILTLTGASTLTSIDMNPAIDGSSAVTLYRGIFIRPDLSVTSVSSATVVGIETNPRIGSTGTYSDLYGLVANPEVGASATVGSVYGIQIDNSAVAGTVANNYGLYVANATGGTNDWAIYTAGGLTYHENSADTVGAFNRTTDDGTIISLQQAGVEEGTISVAGTTISYNAFTGSHYAWTDEVIQMGTLVTLTGDNKRLHGSENSEIMYGIAPTLSKNDSKVMGAYLALQEPNKAKDLHNPHLIMAVGNGEMWVSEEGGNVEAGDYLISSSISGHAMKDDAASSTSYIVARAAEAVNWSDVTETMDSKKHKRISVFFENFTRTNADSTLTKTEDLQTLTSDLNVNGKLLLNVRGIIGLSWSISEDGKLTSKEVEADTVTAKSVIVKQTDAVKTVGEGTFVAGTDTVRVENAAVKLSSKIFISLKGNTGSNWWIAETGDGYFVLKTATLVAAEVKFDYWLLGVIDETTPAPVISIAPPMEEPAVEEPVMEEPSVDESVVEETTP